jgi:hypothetical protein
VIVVRSNQGTWRLSAPSFEHHFKKFLNFNLLEPDQNGWIVVVMGFAKIFFWIVLNLGFFPVKTWHTNRQHFWVWDACFFGLTRSSQIQAILFLPLFMIKNAKQFSSSLVSAKD